MSEYDRLKAQKDKLLDSDKANKAGGLWYRRWYKSQDRIEQLEREVQRLQETNAEQAQIIMQLEALQETADGQ